MPLWTSDKVKQYYIDNNCILLDEFTSWQISMRYICSCGNEGKDNFGNFKNKGRRCKHCGIKKSSKSKTYSQEEVKKIFEDGGCEIIGIYEGKDKPVEYKCECGKISKISLSNFKQGKRCKDCGIKKNCGEGNPRWNPDRNIVRTVRQLQSLSGSYKIKYRKEYNIVESKIHIDHIFPVKAFVEHGIYDLEIINHKDNLRAVSAKENLSKRDSYDKEKFIKKYSIGVH